MNKKGRDHDQRLAKQVERVGAEMLNGAEKRIWSGFRRQHRDSGLGRRGLGGGDTVAKKAGAYGLTEPARGRDLELARAISDFKSRRDDMRNPPSPFADNFPRRPLLCDLCLQGPTASFRVVPRPHIGDLKRIKSPSWAA